MPARVDQNARILRNQSREGTKAFEEESIKFLNSLPNVMTEIKLASVPKEKPKKKRVVKKKGKRVSKVRTTRTN
jgi:hypothetical protein